MALIEDFEVANGNIQVDFTWAPTSPEIGEWVGFSITGVPASDIERAAWTFGGTGCDGTTTTPASPSSVPCDLAPFAYSSGGSKTVQLTVTTTGGVVQPQVQHTLSVQNTGTCGGTTTAPTGSARPRATSPVPAAVEHHRHTTQDRLHVERVRIACRGSPSPPDRAATGPERSATRSPPTPARRGRRTSPSPARTHTVTQDQGIVCTFGLPTHNAVFDPPGGTGSFQVNTNDAGCAWQVSTTANWIPITNGSSHTGTGPVAYLVAENDTPHQRVGIINVTGIRWISRTVHRHPEPPLDPGQLRFHVLCARDRRDRDLHHRRAPGSAQLELHLRRLPGQPAGDDLLRYRRRLQRGRVDLGRCRTQRDHPGDHDRLHHQGADRQEHRRVPAVTAARTDRRKPRSSITPSPALEDEEVTFTDTSSGGGLKILATGLELEPDESGDRPTVTFTITGHDE